MLEKFDALHEGAAGGGGEYACMSGFGWTNGVALLLLERYGWQPAVSL
jgi:alpha,alpha-trehalase